MTAGTMVLSVVRLVASRVESTVGWLAAGMAGTKVAMMAAGKVEKMAERKAPMTAERRAVI